jgi:hypothetical protein
MSTREHLPTLQDFLPLGPTPSDEACAQVGTADYQAQAIHECRRFIALLRHTFGGEPQGARLAVKAFAHDFGTYYEVICRFDPDDQEAVDYAWQCEGHAPATWQGF